MSRQNVWKHRGTEITEECRMRDSVSSVPLCFNRSAQASSTLGTLRNTLLPTLLSDELPVPAALRPSPVCKVEG